MLSGKIAAKHNRLLVATRQVVTAIEARVHAPEMADSADSKGSLRDASSEIHAGFRIYIGTPRTGIHDSFPVTLRNDVKQSRLTKDRAPSVFPETLNSKVSPVPTVSRHALKNRTTPDFAMAPEATILRGGEGDRSPLTA